jgi:hypothetical protein
MRYGKALSASMACTRRSRRRRPASSLATAAAFVCGCSGGGPSATLPAFDDVTSAPPPIQTAAAAVVLVTIPGATATASFISPSGLLLTNNHVLGIGVCPVEGCYAQLTWNYQRGSPFQQPVTVFLVPKAVDIGLDMAVLQASSAPGGPPLPTPSFLTIDSRDPASLEGTHVSIVGHPVGSVKKWTSGEVVYSVGSGRQRSFCLETAGLPSSTTTATSSG